MTASNYPQFFRVHQTFTAPRLDDVPGQVERQLASLDLGRTIRPGHRVAITAGSRGIANIAEIIRAIAGHIHRLGAEPFIIPAMGSHGGATAEGQLRVLATYGITESFCGCPVRSSMETVVVDRVTDNFPLHFDRQAHDANHVILCGRIKPHTGFNGPIESGLAKMMLLGLGKHAGAKIIHRAVQDFGFERVVEMAVPRILATGKIAAGLAIVENAYDETALIEAVSPENLLVREPELLALAKQWMPRLPFDQVDILLIDEIGKEISGTGMDTNIVGRKYNHHRAVEGESPQVRRIVVRGLSPASYGNATGIGMAEFCKTRVLDALDRRATWLNTLTSGNLAAAMIPIALDTDREILDAALATIGLTEPPRAKILWIRNTLDLAEVECSAAYLADAQSRGDLNILKPLRPLPLDAEGHLPSFAEVSEQ